MEQDLGTCPSCGATAPEHSPCPYCGWTPEQTDGIQSLENRSLPSGTPPSDAEIEYASEDPVSGSSFEPPGEQEPSAGLRDLLSPKDDPEHLMEQVPEDMRGVLAARLRAIDEPEVPSFDENTTSTLRDQGFLVSEDARGARLTGSTGQTSDLSSSDVVKMAADLDGGVKPRTTLPICPKCQAASPIGDTSCQWCGEPFPE